MRKYYVQPSADKAGQMFSEEQFEKGIDAFRVKYPDAVVTAINDYNKEDEIDDNNMYVVNVGESHKEIAGDKFRAGRDSFLSKYPDAEIKVMSTVDLNEREATRLEEQMAAMDEANTPAFEEYEYHKSIADNAKLPEKERQASMDFILQHDKAYNTLRAERQALQEQYDKNPYVLQQQRNYSNQNVDELQNEINSLQTEYDKLVQKDKAELSNPSAETRRLKIASFLPMSGTATSMSTQGQRYNLEDEVSKNITKTYEDKQNIRAAQQLLKESQNLYNADKKGDEDSGNIGAMFRGVKDKISDAEFWNTVAAAENGSALNSLHNKIMDLVSTYNNVGEAEAEKILDEKLSDSEKALLDAYMRMGQAQEDNQDIRGWYKAGGVTAESLMFMAEFLAGGDVVGAATSGITKAIARKGAKLAMKATSKAGRAVAKGASKALAAEVRALVGGAVQTTISPTTLVRVQESMNTINEEGQLIEATEGAIAGLVDAYIENASEFGFGPVNKIAGMGAKALNKTLRKLPYGSLYTPKVQDVLKRGGIGGFLEEAGEEVNGAIFRTLLGKATDNKIGNEDEWKEFWQPENLGIMAVSFAPTIGVGAAWSEGQRLYYHRSAKNKENVLRNVLSQEGYSEELINGLFNAANATSPQELADQTAPYIKQFIADIKNDNNRVASAFYNYLYAKSIDNEINARDNKQRQADRESRMQAINTEMGDQQWWYDTPTDKGVIRRTRRIETADGRVGYIVSGNEQDGWTVNYNDGKGGFISEAEIQQGVENGTMYDTKFTTIDEHLDIENTRRRGELERRRMQQQEVDNRKAVLDALTPGSVINIGTEEDPHEGTVRDVQHNKVIVEMHEGGVREINFDDAARYVGVTIQPKTDAQINEEEADLIEKLMNRIDALNERKGSTIERDGNSLTIDGVVFVGGQYKASVRDKDGVQSDIILTDNEIALIEAMPPVTAQTQQETAPEVTPEVATPAEEEQKSDLPLKEDNKTVDQTALWNENPERWAEYNDGRKGREDTRQYINLAIAKQAERIAAIDAAMQTETDFDARDTLYEERQREQSRLERLQALQRQYENDIQVTPTVEAPAAQSEGVESLSPVAEKQEKNTTLAKPKSKKKTSTPTHKGERYVEELGAMGEYLSFRDFVLRYFAGGGRVAWSDNGPIKGLGSHLGLKGSRAERSKRIWLLSKDAPAPERLAEGLLLDYAQEVMPWAEDYEERIMSTIDAFNEVLDVLMSHDTPSSMLAELRELHSRGTELERLEEEYYRQEAFYETHHMTEEEYEVYEEVQREMYEADEAIYAERERYFDEERVREYEQLNNIDYGQNERTVEAGDKAVDQRVPEGQGQRADTQGSTEILSETQPDSESGSGQRTDARAESRANEEGTDNISAQSQDRGSRTDGQSGTIAEPTTTEETRADSKENELAISRSKGGRLYTIAINHINEWAKKLGVEIEIVERFEDLTNGDAIAQVLSGKYMPGFYETTTGKVVLYMPHLMSMAYNPLTEIDKTVMHEVVAHKGLRKMLGGQQYKKLCERVFDAMPTEVQEKYLNYPGVKGRKHAAGDEIIAHFAENREMTEEERTLWQKIVDFVRNLLGITPTSQELDRLIRQSYTALLSSRSQADGQMAEGENRYRVYKSQDGKETRFAQLSLQFGGDTAINDGSGPANVQREGDTTLTTLNTLRKLEEGEVCNVERIFTESKEFNFTRGEKIESADDVAYIFKNLEDEAIENTFIALVKDGEVTVIHVGMGSQIGAPVDLTAVITAANRIKPEKVYFIHNHPSGNLQCSRPDMEALGDLGKVLGDIVQEGIIINTRSGQYGTFNHKDGNIDTLDIPANQDSFPLKVYKFNKQAFKNDITKVTSSSEGIAEFVSTQRLGSRDKINALLLNNHFGCVGNVFLTETEITSANADRVARKLIADAMAMGAMGVVLYGRSPMVTVSDMGSSIVLSDKVAQMSDKNVRLLDVMQIDDRGGRSAAGYGVRFRTTITPEVREEMEGIKANAIANGVFMKAPNGKDTNLNEEQWLMVRTSNFKKWFGDWEDNPAGASKVVDENGEPMVVYHGSPYKFTEFSPNRIGYSTGTADGRGFYFTTDKTFAEAYKTAEGELYQVFLNIKNPLDYNKLSITKSQLKSIISDMDKTEVEQEGEHYFISNYEDYTRVGVNKAIQEATNLEYKYAENDVELINSIIGASGDFTLVMDSVEKVTGKGSLISPKANGTTHYIVTSPNQIKSATDNNGEFSESDDIRFSVIGEVGARRDKTKDGLIRLDNLETAREMEAQLNPDWNAKENADALKIKLATGWERGVDGMWRYETSDFQLKPFNTLISGYGPKTFGDIVTYSDLFNIYPELRNIKIKKGRGKRYMSASYAKEDNTMELPYTIMKEVGRRLKEDPNNPTNQVYLERIMDYLKNAVVHEAQHAIQHIEGFARGGNPEMINDANRLREINNLVDEYNSIVKVYNENVDNKAEADVLEDIDNQLTSIKKQIDSSNRKYKIGKDGYIKLAGEVESRNVSARQTLTDEQKRSSLLASTEDVAREDQIILEQAVLEQFNEEEGVRFRTLEERKTLRESEESKLIFDTAKEKFGTTYDLRETGYILPDGSMLDFSGRHEIRGADTSFLDGDRTVDHRAIREIEYDFDENETGVKTDMGDFLDRGAVRIDVGAGAINLNIPPTSKQKDILRRLIERNDGYVYVDFGNGWDTEHYAEYEDTTSRRILNDIDRYYSEGIKPAGDIRFRIEDISSLEPSKVVDKIKDCYYSDVSELDRIAMVEYLQQSKEGKDVINRLYKHNGTGWAKQTVNATFVRIALNDLLEGREPSVSSMLTRGDEHPVVKYIKKQGKEGVWRYIQEYDIIGKAGKPVNNVNGSFLSCNPSNECAKYCYATTGHYVYTTPSVKSELIYWAINDDPIRAARRIVAEYKARRQYYEGKALRLFDKGDIDKSWLPVIAELNKQGVVTQIFSKHPEVLEEVDKNLNVVMMSIDSSNTELLDAYPTLPIALVYRGAEDLSILEKCRERFEQYGGVILPVKVGQKILNENEIKALPLWTKPYQCPIDNGKRLIEDKENPERSWNCTRCDKNAGVGCFFHRTAIKLRNEYENKGQAIIGNAEGGNQRAAAGNAEGSVGRPMALYSTNDILGNNDFRRGLLRAIRESLREGGISDADITPELMETVDGRLRRMLEGWRKQPLNSVLSGNSSEESGTFRREGEEWSRPESDGGITPEGTTHFRVANENQEIFVSNAQRAVESIKQEKATPEQWLAMITKQGGIKAGEDKWLGLSEWLKASDAKTITKQEVLDFIAENKIQIEEVNYSETPQYIYNDFDEAFYAEEADEFYGTLGVGISDLRKAIQLYNENNPDSPIEEADDIPNEDYDKLIEFGTQLFYQKPERGINSTRLGYTTEGLENKREIALTVPTIESWNQGDEVHFGDAGDGRVVAWIRFGEASYYEAVEDVQEATEFHEPYKNVNGRDVYKPVGGFRSGDYIVYGQAKTGDMIYVVYINDNQIPVTHSTLEEARIAMNEYYKEHPRKLRKANRVLVIDEIQSKRHQEGREKGYADESTITEIKQQIDALLAEQEQIAKDILHKLGYIYHNEEDGQYSDEHEYKAITGRIGSAEQMARQKEIDSQLYELNHKLREERGGIPDAPFDKNWHELAMKRMLRLAAEEGYDYVAWTKGAQQAYRYDMSKIIDYIDAESYGNGLYNINVATNDDSHFIRENNISESRLTELVGKDMALSIIKATQESEDGHVTIEGDGLRIGGEGMKGFYDNMLPSFVKKYTKKWGAIVEDIELPNLEESARVMHSVNITPEMKESVMQGQTMFRIGNNEQTRELNAKQAKTADARVIQREAESDIRFSVSKNNRATINKWLDKRPDITEDERNAFFFEIDDKEPMVQLATAKWFANGAIRLPEDQLTVDEAIRNARKMNVDPISYAAPGIINKQYRESFGEDERDKEDLLSPDDARFEGILTNKTEYGNGIVVYDVQNDRVGQDAVRELMNDHLGKDFNCWCLLYANADGKVTESARGYWGNYNSIQKRVAFKDGKICSFCASDSGSTEWWDLSDVSHYNNIPIEMDIPNDELGRKTSYGYNEETGEFNRDEDAVIFRGNRKNGIYEEWYSEDPHSLAKRINYKGGEMHGKREEWHENGQMSFRGTYKNGVPNGHIDKWSDNGQKTENSNYVNGEVEGLYESWYSDGTPKARYTAKNGKLEGLYESWHHNGRLAKKVIYKDGFEGGLSESWYTNGQLEKKFFSKDGYNIGEYLTFYSDGTPHAKYNFNEEGHRDGLQESYHPNGNIKARAIYEDGVYEGVSEEWDESGHLLRRTPYKNGKINGIKESYNLYTHNLELRGSFENGKLHGVFEEYDNYGLLRIRQNYENGELNGVAETYHPNATVSSRTHYKNGQRHGLFERWYKNGQRHASSYYTFDRLDGIAKSWHQNGQLSSLSYYDYGIQEGKSFHLDNYGDFMSIETYKHGVMDGESLYFEDGILTDIVEFEKGRRTATKRATEEEKRSIVEALDKEVQELLERHEREVAEASNEESNTLFRIKEVNDKFNSELETLNEENADKVVLNVGDPSPVLLSAGVEDRPMKLYGNKIIKKVKKHGLKIQDLKNLPSAVADPIAVFDNYKQDGNRSILTELRVADGNILATIDLGKGTDIDFNIVSSTFGKSDNKIVSWINKGFATYINKEKALDYLHLSAPIAEASDKKELSSATNIVEKFENPTIATEKTTDEAGTSFRVVTDEAKLNELESGEKIEAYRAVQIDANGTLYSPMASQIKSTKGGVKAINDAAQMNQWDEAVENVDKVDEKGRITIMDEDGGSNSVAYNPYGHCCVNSMMNDQFKRAYKRDNLYVMRVLAPVSELTSGYHAEKAKDAVGIHKWKTGVVGRQLPEDKRRKILLTRWMKNVEVMSWEDVAQDWIKTLKGENISVPFNVIPRKILNMLSEAGIDIVAPEKGMENASGAYEQWLTNPIEYVGDTNLPAQVKALNEQTRFRTQWQEPPVRVMELLQGMTGMTRQQLIDKYAPASAMGENEQQESMAGYPEKVNAINATAEKLGARVEIVGREDMPNGYTNAMGVWRNGAIYLCPANIPDTEEAVRTVLHEAVGHEGLRRLVGAENMTSFCMELYKTLPSSRRAIIDISRNSKGWNIEEAVEEYLAEKAQDFNFESEETKTLWDTIRTALRNALVKIGINVPLSERDVRWLTYRSAKALDNNFMTDLAKATLAHKLGFAPTAQAARAEAQDIIRARDAQEGTTLFSASKDYNRSIANWANRLHESYVDMNNSVNNLVEAIEKATGEEAKSFEDIRIALNQMSSKGLAMIEEWERKYWMPLASTINKIVERTGFSVEDIERYLMLKHAIERNEVFAQRDARRQRQQEFENEKARIQNDGSITDIHKEQQIADAEALLQSQLADIDNKVDAVYLENREIDYGGLTGLYTDYGAVGEYDELIESREEYQQRLDAARKKIYKEVSDMENAAKKEIQMFEDSMGKDSVEDLWKKINASTKATLKIQYDSNMISRSQYEHLKGMFEYYIPLRGFAENTAEDIFEYYQQHQVVHYTRPIQRAGGRRSQAGSPLGYIGAQASSAVAEGIKNEAKLTLYYFTSNRANNGLIVLSDTWYEVSADAKGRKVYTPVYPPFVEELSSDAAKQAYEKWEEDMKVKRDAGLAVKRWRKTQDAKVNYVIQQSRRQAQSHIIKVRVGGEEKFMFINGNPRAAQAINNELNVEMSGDYQHFFGKALRWFSGINTQYNPEFWISNAQRDLLFSLMSVNVKDDKEYNRVFHKNLRKALKVFQYKRGYENGKTPASIEERRYKEFVENGGVTGYTYVKGHEEWEAQIRKIGLNGEEENILRKLFNGVEHIGNSIEQITRFAAFMTSREQGKEIRDAVADAKELTVNFNRKGSGKAISWEETNKLRKKNGKKLNNFERALVMTASWLPAYGRRFIMFFNAAVQGLNAFYKLHKANPKKLAKWSTAYLALGVMNAALHGMLDDDEDEKGQYLDLPDYERRNYALIGGSGIYLKWALPQEMRVFYGLGDIMYNQLSGRSPHKNIVAELAESTLEVFPLNPSEGVSSLVPTAAAPFVEAYLLNRNFMGSKIYNDMPYLSDEEKRRTPEYKKAFSSTGDLFVDMSKLLNEISGGDESTSGFLDGVATNPAAVEHIVQSLVGGAGTTVMRFYRSTVGQLFGEDLSVRNTPFLNRLLTVSDDRYRNAYVNDVYDFYRAEAEHTKTRIRQYDKSRNKEASRELKESKDYQIMRIYEKYRKKIDRFNDMLKVTDGYEERKEIAREQDAIKRQMIKEISELK